MSAGLLGLLGSWQDMKKKQEVSIREPLLCTETSGKFETVRCAGSGLDKEPQGFGS